MGCLSRGNFRGVIRGAHPKTSYFRRTDCTKLIVELSLIRGGFNVLKGGVNLSVPFLNTYFHCSLRALSGGIITAFPLWVSCLDITNGGLDYNKETNRETLKVLFTTSLSIHFCAA